MNSLFDNRAITFAFAFILAVLLFYYVRGEIHTRHMINVQLNYQKSNRVVAVGPKVKSIQVDLRGPDAVLSNVMKQKYQIDIDISQEKPGTVIRGNFESMIVNELPHEVVILNIIPREIKLELEPYATRTVDLETEVKGTPPEGYQITKTTIDPEHVVIAGAQSAIEKIEKLKIGPVVVNGAQVPVKQEFALSTGSEDAWLTDKTKARVLVQIEEKIIQKTIQVPVTLENSKLKHSVTPARISLVVEGPYGLVQALAPKDFSAYVDGETMHSGFYRQAVAIHSPDAVKLIDNQPRYFSIRLWK